MSFLGLDELQNLKELKNLDKLENMDNLQQLQKLDQMEHMDHLDKLDNLQQLPELEHMDQLQNIQGLDQLQNMDSLKNLDQLQNMQALHQLSNLDMMKYMQSLGQLYRLDHLKQLQLLNRMEELEKLNNLQSLQNLKLLKNLDQMQSLHELPQLNQLNQLDQLSQLSQMSQLQNLQGLDKLQPLNQLQVLKPVTSSLNYNSLLLLLSVIVPGFVFLEVFGFFFRKRLGIRHSLMMMVVYNIVNMLVCMLMIYSHVNSPLYKSNPVLYCLVWFAVLLLIPAMLGWGVALLSRLPAMSSIVTRMTPQAVRSAWDRFLTEAESYTVTITLNNEEKLQGIFRRGMPTPSTSDPNDLFFTETSHLEPNATEWKALEHPVGVWVKGSEIKFLEVTPLDERRFAG